MNELKSAFLVQHVRNEKEDTSKVIGIYSSREEANSAIRRLADKAGFRDHPDGFYIDEYTLNEDNWTEGFGVL